MLATGILAAWNFSTTHAGGTANTAQETSEVLRDAFDAPPTAHTKSAIFSSMQISTSSASFPPVSDMWGQYFSVFGSDTGH